MGKGTIASGGTDGLYQVTLDYGQAARDARVAKVTADLAALVTKIADAQALLDTQQAIEDAQKVVVDAAVDSYATVSHEVGPALEAVQAAKTAMENADTDLKAIVAAPEGTLPDVAALQAAFTALHEAQVSTEYAAVTNRDTALVVLGSVQAAGLNLDGAHDPFDAAQSNFQTTQSVAQVKTTELVTALQAGGPATVEQTAYNAAMTQFATAFDGFGDELVLFTNSFNSLKNTQLDLRDVQTIQATGDSAALTAAASYTAAGQELLTIYMADGSAAEATKASLNAALIELHDIFPDTYGLTLAHTEALAASHLALESAEDSAATTFHAIEITAFSLLNKGRDVYEKREAYVAAALLAPEVFASAADVYDDALTAFSAATTDFNQSYTDYFAAYDTATTATAAMAVATMNTFDSFAMLMGVNVDYAAAAQAPLSSFTLTTAAINRTHDAAQDALSAAQAALTAANTAYAALQDALQAALKAYTDAATELARIKGQTAALRIPLQLLKAEQVQLTKDLATWTALVLTETVPAWCADLTEDASGEVATVEIPGENKLVLIAPAAPAPGPADGLLTAREVQSPEQAFWNAAVLPGWQKWKPTYRRGTITAIDYDADTASVTLFEDVSSARNLPINQSANLTAVPVDYMQCDAEAFDVGDVVVVKFTGQDWANPRVIGFCDNPKECPGQAGWSVYGATHYEGTWSRGSSAGPYEWNRYSRPGYGGNVSYSSALGVVSWWGQAGICCGGLMWPATATVYYRGTAFGLAGSGIVRGASLAVANGVKYIISIVLLGYENVYKVYKTNPKTGVSSVIATIDVPTGELGAYFYDGDYYFATTPIFFDVATGLKGATLVYTSNTAVDGRPRVCEYTVSADLSGVVRALGEPLSIGYGSTSGEAFTDLFRVYMAAFYDAEGVLKTAYYEVYGEGPGGPNVSYSGNVMVGSEVWWSGTFATAYTSYSGHWEYAATADGLRAGVYSAGIHMLALDPRNRKSLMVRGMYGATNLVSGIVGSVWTATHTTKEECRGEANAVLLVGTAISAIGDTPSGGWGSGSASCDGERMAAVNDMVVLASDRPGPNVYAGAAAAAQEHVVMMAMANKAEGGNIYKLIADDFSEAGFLAASGLPMPDDALFTSPRIYFGVMT